MCQIKHTCGFNGPVGSQSGGTRLKCVQRGLNAQRLRLKNEKDHVAVKGCGRTLSPCLVFTFSFLLLSALLFFSHATLLISFLETKLWLIHSVMLVTGKQPSDSYIYIYIYI